MLKSKIAIALAAAMVMAALYGCSSGVSDSTHNQVKNQVTDLEGTVNAVAMALGLAAGSSEADILSALAMATEDQLVAIRTTLELAADATAADIVTSIGLLQVDELVDIRAELGLPADATVADILAAIRNLQTGPPVFVDQSGLPDDVMQMAGNADIAAGESATIGEVTYSCAAGGADCTVMVNEDGAAVSTGGMVTAAVAQAYTDRKDAEAKEAERLAMVAATTKSAETKEKAIAAEAAQTAANDGDLGGSQADGTPVDTYSMTIERDRDGTTIKIADTALAGDDDPKFAEMMDLGDGRTMHARAMEADDDGNVVEEVVIVSTDIEAPKATPFAMVAGQTLTLRKDGETATDEDPNDSLTVEAGTDNVNLPKIMADAFSAATGSSVTHTFQPAADDADTVTTGDQPRDAAEVMGSYNGGMGTYTCNTGDGGADCTVTVNGKGEITAISAGWIFTPNTGATSDVPDSDYLNYGFWLKKTTDSADAVTYNEVETFAGSSVAASGDVSAVRGSATYNGGAVGVYVHRTFANDGTSDATSGHFEADVSLKATFGQVHEGDDPADTSQPGTIAANLLNTVTGTIDNFDLSGGKGNMWSVALSGDITAGGGTASGTAKGGMGDGSFSATFHGDVAAGTDGAVPNPSSVVGEFNAGFTNGSVAGAFGAREAND